MQHALVVLLGMGTVFFGLICIVFLCMGMSAVIRSFEKAVPAPEAEIKSSTNNAPIQNRQEIIAAVCAVIAEDSGCDMKNIKVVSFKRV